MVLVLRGVNAFARVEDVVRCRGPHQYTVPVVRLDKIMSPTPELAFRSVQLEYITTAGMFCVRIW